MRRKTMNKQRGLVELYVVGIVLAMGIAACGGLWAYYKSEVKGLESQVVEKQKTIETMGQEKATCLEANTGLSTANTNFVGQVNECRASVVAIQKDRNDKAAEARAAKQDADRKSLDAKQRIAAIIAQAAGVDWCKTWGAMVTDYTVMRQTGVAK